LDEDGNFDGTTLAERQVGLVSARGGNAQYTGATAQQADWAGAQGEGMLSVQGNGLAGPEVLAAMQRVFAASHGELAARLLAALEAGQAAGGQRSGQWSAALLVRTPGGDWQDTDLRVDADPRAVARLRELYDMRLSNEAIIRAEERWEKGDVAGARAALATSLSLAHGWDRTWARAARVAMRQGDTALAREYLRDFGIVGVSAERRRQGKAVIAVDLGFEARLRGEEPVFAQHQPSQLGLGRRVVEAHERLARLHALPFVHQHLANDAAFQVLHLLVLPGGDERARRHDRAVERGERRPQAEADDPNSEDG